MKHTILTFVQNRPGVLNKVSGLLRRKMYNIDSLTVSDTGDPTISGMTITISTEDPEKVNQMMKQIGKMTEVISIKNLDPEKSFWREVALIKCGLKKSKIEHILKNYNAEILHEDDSKNQTIVQVAGTSKKIDDFIGEISISNIIDMTRSGVTAMEIENIGADFGFRDSVSEVEKRTNF